MVYINAIKPNTGKLTPAFTGETPRRSDVATTNRLSAPFDGGHS